MESARPHGEAVNATARETPGHGAYARRALLEWDLLSVPKSVSSLPISERRRRPAPGPLLLSFMALALDHMAVPSVASLRHDFVTTALAPHPLICFREGAIPGQSAGTSASREL